MLTSTIIAVGVYRDHFPTVPWWLLMLVGGTIYLVLAWIVGLIDEWLGLFKIEQGQYAVKNPELMSIKDTVERIAESQNHGLEGL
jgi:uncharacterized membrane protein YcjF (UPF0283 family)